MGLIEKLGAAELSAPGVSVPFACDHGQYERLLATFARLVPYETEPLETIITREGDLFSPGTTVILVGTGTTLRQEMIEHLLDMRPRGIALHLVLIGDLARKTIPEIYDVPVHYLGGREQWHELLQAVGNPASEGLDSNATGLQLD
jgi:hypothetical protein